MIWWFGGAAVRRCWFGVVLLCRLIYWCFDSCGWYDFVVWWLRGFVATVLRCGGCHCVGLWICLGLGAASGFLVLQLSGFSGFPSFPSFSSFSVLRFGFCGVDSFVRFWIAIIVGG